MLEIQKYINEFDNIKDANDGLRQQYSIDVKEELLCVPVTEFTKGRYTVFTYNYTKDSPIDVALVQEARGLVLDKSAEVVSSSFKYIPELNSYNMSAVSWYTARAELQSDGVLIVIYSYKRQWFIQTKESANAENSMPDCGIPYRTAVLSVLKELFGNESPFKPFDDCVDEDMCYVFEFVSPYNRKVTPYNSSNLILLSAFNKVSGSEQPSGWLIAFNYDFADRKFRQPRALVVNDVNGVRKLVANMEATHKGIVVKDFAGGRFKMTNPKYKELKKIVDIGTNLTPRHLAKAVVEGHGIHLGAVNGAYQDVTNMIFDSMIALGNEIREIWESNKLYERKPYFAKRIADYPKITRSVLFMFRRDQAATMREAFERMDPKLFVSVARKRHGDKFDKKFEEMKTELRIWR